MYPDSQDIFEKDPHEFDFCPTLKDGSFESCLAKHKVNDSKHPEYEKCHTNYTNLIEKCRKSLQWGPNLLKKHYIRTRPTKCDKFNYVYFLNLDESNFGKPYHKCERPFVVKRIANSNLILLIAKSECEKSVYYEFNDSPKDVNQGVSLFCKKLESPLYRRHSRICFRHHTNVRFMRYDIYREFL
jgi:Neuronal voltage-dependent calcium channel alpha 2acd